MLKLLQQTSAAIIHTQKKTINRIHFRFQLWKAIYCLSARIDRSWSGLPLHASSSQPDQVWGSDQTSLALGHVSGCIHVYVWMPDVIGRSAAFTLCQESLSIPQSDDLSGNTWRAVTGCRVWPRHPPTVTTTSTSLPPPHSPFTLY